MRKDNTIKAFFALVRVGLWGNDIVHDSWLMGQDASIIDWQEVYQLVQEQSVQGLVLQGIEEVQKSWQRGLGSSFVPQMILLQWIGEVQFIEHQNKAMNAFINQLMSTLRKENIYALLVKGQGVAQCYERSLWRSSGDIDLYLNEDDFQKAKVFFRPLVDKFDPDDDSARHINMHYGEWVVEIHANQKCSLSPKINEVLSEVHNDLFYRGNVRSWDNNGTLIFLPSANNDAIIIFTHFFNHFYRGGVGLRQICDWCRLLWTYRDTLDLKLLEKRVRKSGLKSEWRAFGAFAVMYLGMPIEAMPLLNVRGKKEDGRCEIDANLRKKADRICEFILEVGNFGQNRDMSYYRKYPYVIRKAISAWWRMKDLCRHAMIFPLDSLRFSFSIMFNGFRSAVRGE